MRNQLYCQICGVELFNSLDTYGELGDERCFHCHFTQPRVGKNDIVTLYFYQNEAEWQLEGAMKDYNEAIDSAQFRMKYAIERDDQPRITDIRREMHGYDLELEPYRREYFQALIPYEKALWWEQWWRENTVQR